MTHLTTRKDMFEPVAPADQGWKRSHSFYLKLSISLNLFPISMEAAISDPKVLLDCFIASKTHSLNLACACNINIHSLKKECFPSHSFLKHYKTVVIKFNNPLFQQPPATPS